jgi:glutamate racemase
MHILITDSGVGGLSVCAYAERFLRTHAVTIPFKLTYVNASPENDFGYNSMGSRAEKIEYFDRFLRIIYKTYSPDEIHIACNTLSVIFPETSYSNSLRIPVRGIVETGVERLFRELERFPHSIAAIFGTVTTIEEGTYSKLLLSKGVEAQRIVAQACPSLADTISEDRRGSIARAKIEEYVGETLEKIPEQSAKYIGYLGCTHYGYRRDYFSNAFERNGIDSLLLNPNDFMVDDLYSGFVESFSKSSESNDVDVEFISRYKIPETALATISYFLEGVSPRTIQAFTNYSYMPDLF